VFRFVLAVLKLEFEFVTLEFLAASELLTVVEVGFGIDGLTILDGAFNPDNLD
jgi:hypothetical protein